MADRSSDPQVNDSHWPGDWPAGDSLAERLQRGESQAIRDLFDKYSHQLEQIAAKNIHAGLKRRFDGEDIVQSAFRTFFRRQQDNQFRIKHSDQLWRLLVRITLCKTRSHARRHTAARRDAKAEKAGAVDWESLGQEASPQDVIALWEEVDAVLEGLPDQAGDILFKRIEGETKSDIARQLNLSRQTIHRILKLVETRLSERLEHYI